MSVKERPNVMYLECEGVVRVWTYIFIHVLFSLLMHSLPKAADHNWCIFTSK